MLTFEVLADRWVKTRRTTFDSVFVIEAAPVYASPSSFPNEDDSLSGEVSLLWMERVSPFSLSMTLRSSGTSWEMSCILGSV